MAALATASQTLTLKLVYYGPALSGKTTNVLRLHDIVPDRIKGEMMVLDAKQDRTLFFDLLPLGIRVSPDLLVKLKIFTVPGQVAHDSTRKAVLSGAHGVVFVADSQLTQKQNNLLSFESLMDNAERVGLDPERLPIAIQFNKRDLNPIISEEEVRQRWASTPWPLFFSSALNGQGVLDTFRGLLERVIPRELEEIDNIHDIEVSGAHDNGTHGESPIDTQNGVGQNTVECYCNQIIDAIFQD